MLRILSGLASRTTSRCLLLQRCYSSKRSEPLRILFCGSDDFSCASLRALHREHVQNPELVKSLDVVVRPGKPTGQGMKVIRQVPLQGLANDLGLRTHERDTFTGWKMPMVEDEPINLIVAVSFGLFVPPRLLKASKYGGLNVHPSFLPDLRGAAPLQHTILQRRSHVGITVQTLDASRFDHGAILSQTPWPGIPIPPSLMSLPPTSTTAAKDSGTESSSHPTATSTKPPYQALLDLVAGPAAGMLVAVLRSARYVPPLNPQPSALLAARPDAALWSAPKIRPHDRQVPWFGPGTITAPCSSPSGGTSNSNGNGNDSGSDVSRHHPGPGSWTAAELAWRRFVLGPLWSQALDRDGAERRVLFEGVETVAAADAPAGAAAWMRRARRTMARRGGGLMGRRSTGGAEVARDVPDADVDVSTGSTSPARDARTLQMRGAGASGGGLAQEQEASAAAADAPASPSSALTDEAKAQSCSSSRPPLDHDADGNEQDELADGVDVRPVTWLWTPPPQEVLGTRASGPRGESAGAETSSAPLSDAGSTSSAAGSNGSSPTLHAAATNEHTSPAEAKATTPANGALLTSTPRSTTKMTEKANPQQRIPFRAPYFPQPDGSVLIPEPLSPASSPSSSPGFLLVRTVRVGGDRGGPKAAAKVLGERFADEAPPGALWEWDLADLLHAGLVEVPFEWVAKGAREAGEWLP